MPVDMNETIAQASLDNLHNIIVPDAIGFFPPAPGWYIVLLLLVTLLFQFGVQYYQAYQKARYRRDALAQLKALEEKNKENILALLALAKKVAISAYGRSRVAKLHEERWWDFVEEHSRAKVGADLRVKIETFLYDDHSEFSDELFESIWAFVSRWIKTHRAGADV